MSALVPADVIIGNPPAAPPARPRVLLIGTVLGCAGAVMGFAALLAMYVNERAAAVSSGQPWLPKGADIPTTPGTVSLVTLAMSVVVVQWAVWSIRNDDRRHTYLALGIAALLGAAYINGIAFAYSQMGVTVNDKVGLLIFALTGSHLVLAGAGILFMALMAFRTLGGAYSGRDYEGLAALAIYWYVTVGIYAVIWFTLFIKK